jgi:hypothetical protein
MSLKIAAATLLKGMIPTPKDFSSALSESCNADLNSLYIVVEKGFIDILAWMSSQSAVVQPGRQVLFVAATVTLGPVFIQK